MAKREFGFGAARALTVAAAAVLALLLDGCMTVDHQSPPTTTPQPGIVDRILAFDLKPRFADSRSVGSVRSDSAIGAATYYGDTATPAVAAPASPDASVPDPPTTGALGDAGRAVGKDQGYEMNFEDTPVGTVAKAVLGDILGVGYAIDTRVKGTVSLSSGRPVAKKDILYVLESALRVSGIALVRDGRDYRLIPAADALGSASIDKRAGGDAGYGITVVPLQFVSAPTVIKLLENFAAKPGMVRAEPSRNLLIIQGNGPDRRSAVETVLSFDADWMRGQSVGIYPVSNSTPEPIIAELERIIDSGEGGLGQNLVKLQPIARQNAVLVVTRRPELLDRVATWVRRLDRSGGAGTGVKVYRMRYGDARQVAALLNDMFLGAGNGVDSPTNQLAPGGGVATSSSGPSSTSPGASGFSSTRGTTASTGQAGSSFDGRFADASAGRSTAGSGGPGSTGGRGGLANATASSG
jgi:general secretion pathway protein D